MCTIESCEKIAIMGGTFDPIHYGHLTSAETVRQEFGFNKIIFIPSGTPPHKSPRNVTGGELRYLMTSVAAASNIYFDVSRVEIDRMGNSYTVDTITEIKKKLMPTAAINFITGADALLDMLSWHNAENIFRLCSIIALNRPGFENAELLNRIEHLTKIFNADITYLEVPALAISSSDIRNRVKTGMSIKYLVPDPVIDIINKYNLYRQ